MRASTRLGALLPCVVVVLGACAPAAPTPVPPLVVKKNEKKPEPKEKPPEHPARWLLEPEAYWSARARLDLGEDRGTIYAGQSGERWLLTKKSPAVAAAQLFPEEIVGALRLQDGKTVFIASSGTTYLTLDPLGAVIAMHAPPHPVRVAAAGKSALLLITVQNELLRSTDGGSTWNRVVLPKSDATWMDVAMSTNKGLLLGMPQRAFYTLDDGASFTAIPTPGIGALRTYVDIDGQLLLGGLSERARFRDAPPAFEISKSTGSTTPKLEKPEKALKRAALSGTKLYELAWSPTYHSDKGSSGGESRYTFSASEVGASAQPKKMPLLDACKSVELGALDEVVEIVCPADVEVDGDSGTKTTRSVIRFYRSTDAGKTFVEDGTTFEALTDTHPFVGPDGFLLFRNERCSKPSYSKYKGPMPAKTCGSAWLRGAGSTKLAAVPDGTTVHHAWVAVDARRKEMLTLGESIDSHSISLYRFKIDGSAPEKVSLVDGDADAWSLGSGAIAVDESGAISIALRGGSPRTWKLHRSYDEGATFQTTPLPDEVSSIALSGKRMLAAGSTSAFESIDSGATWSRVPSPVRASVLECSAYGCLTARGLRVGWDSPVEPTHAIEIKRAKKWATPLQCKLEGTWIDAARGELPDANGIDPTPSLRSIAPKRLEDERVALVVTDAAGKSKELPMLGPPSKAELARAQTITYVQPGGVVAVRYSYLRKKQPFGPLSKVDVDLAWYSIASGKVHHASIKQIGTWKVAHDPQPPGTLPEAYPNSPEIAAIGSGGLWFEAPMYEPDPKVLFVRENGTVEKHPTPIDAGPFGVLTVARVGKELMWFDGLGQDGGVRSASYDTESKGWKTRTWTLWASRTGHRAPFVAPLDLAGRPGIHVTFRGDDAYAPADFAVALEATADPGAMVPTATQSSLADPPLGCEGPALSGARTLSHATLGARHPVVIAGESTPIVLATDEAILRTTGSATCVSSYLARSTSAPMPASDYAAVVRPSALASATLYRVDRSVWPAKLQTRTMSCSFTPGPLPKELEKEDGF